MSNLDILLSQEGWSHENMDDPTTQLGYLNPSSEVMTMQGWEGSSSTVDHLVLTSKNVDIMKAIEEITSEPQRCLVSDLIYSVSDDGSEDIIVSWLHQNEEYMSDEEKLWNEIASKLWYKYKPYDEGRNSP